MLLSVRNDSDAASLGFDTSVPNPARMYDYLIGGKIGISQEVRADFRNRDRT
jgi:hypothetical protein